MMRESNKNTSVNIAKQRLHRLLTSDRLHCSPTHILQMKEDVFQVLSKYMEINIDNYDLILTRREMHIIYTGEK